MAQNELSKLAVELRRRRVEATSRLEKILADAAAGTPGDVNEVERLLPIGGWTIEMIESRAREANFVQQKSFIPGFS